MTALSAIPRIAQCTLEPVLGGVSVVGLGALVDPQHEANAIVEASCSQGCGATFQCRLFFQYVTACEQCRSKSDKAERLDRAKTYWEALCPPSFRETDKDHAGFPKAQYKATEDYTGHESLFFFGPTRTGKSRLAVLLLKRALVRFNLHVGILWPEQLKAVKNSREVLEWVTKWGRYDLLLMDDALLTGASDGRVTEALKDLLDYRIRYKRHNIITSQIGSADYAEQSEKQDKRNDRQTTKADKEVVKALIERVRETSRVVSFAEVKPQGNEEAF